MLLGCSGCIVSLHEMLGAHDGLTRGSRSWIDTLRSSTSVLSGAHAIALHGWVPHVSTRLRVLCHQAETMLSRGGLRQLT